MTLSKGAAVQERRRLNDTWELDLRTFVWRKQTCEKTSPAPRDNAAAVFCQGYMVVFGGHTNGKRLNDLAVLDLSSYTWTTWASVVGQPSPRESAALCVGHGNLLFLHGGCSNFGMDDLWVYDQKAQAWTEVACGGRKPPIRRGHQLFVYDSQLYAFGGYDELGAPACTLFKLPVAYGTNFAVGQLDWEELHSDRVFNRNRCAHSPGCHLLHPTQAAAYGDLLECKHASGGAFTCSAGTCMPCLQAGADGSVSRAFGRPQPARGPPAVFSARQPHAGRRQ